MSYTPAYDLLMNMSLLQAVDAQNTAVMGVWWVIFIYLFVLIGSWVTTKEEAIVFGIAILVTPGLSYLYAGSVPIYIHGILYIILAMSFSLLVYRVYMHGD